MPLLTVIIPNYNHGRFLDRRLKSIINQDFQDFEMIIIDDASTDNSREIIEKYRDHPKLRTIVYNDINSGSPIQQWIKGIALAQTEWIWIAESDDSCDVNFLSNLLPAIATKDCVMAMHEIAFIDEADNVVMSFPSIGEGWFTGKDFLHAYMLDNCYVCNAGMTVFRKSAIPANYDWVRSLAYAPDYYFWCKTMCNGKVYTSGKTKAYFRKHPQEFTAGKYDSIVEHRDHAIIMHKLFQEGKLDPASLASLIKRKLTGLSTQKKGIEPDTYKTYCNIWLNLASSCQIAINPLEIGLQATLRKIKHKLGK